MALKANPYYHASGGYLSGDVYGLMVCRSEELDFCPQSSKGKFCFSISGHDGGDTGEIYISLQDARLLAYYILRTVPSQKSVRRPRTRK